MSLGVVVESCGSWGVLGDSLRGPGEVPGILGGVPGGILGRSLTSLGESGRILGGPLSLLGRPWGLLETIDDLKRRLCRKPSENKWKTIKRASSGRPWGSWRRFSGRLRGLSGRLWGVLGRVGSSWDASAPPRDASGACRDMQGSSWVAPEASRGRPGAPPVAHSSLASAPGTPQELLGGVPGTPQDPRVRPSRTRGLFVNASLRDASLCFRFAPL